MVNNGNQMNNFTTLIKRYDPISMLPMSMTSAQVTSISISITHG